MIMKWKERRSGIGARLPLWACLACSLLWAVQATAQTCMSADEMDAPTQKALADAAKRYFDMSARGDSASLKQNSIASLANDFSGIETAVRDNQPNFTGAQATARPPYLLKVEGTAPIARAEFLCGVFGAQGQTSSSAVFVIPNLPPGNYGVVIVDISGSKGGYTASYILQQQASDWKLGGLYVKPSQVKGHDGKWFWDQARDLRAKGQVHNAWFYYLQARDLLAPVPFMSTQLTDKLYDESQAAKPADLTAPLTSGAKIYTLTDLFPMAVGNDLDLVVKYQLADISNTGQTFQENMSVIKGLVSKYPEYRSAFDGVVARAVDPSGRDYGSLLAMKDIK